jgi:hypothetical protein
MTRCTFRSLLCVALQVSFVQACGVGEILSPNGPTNDETSREDAEGSGDNAGAGGGGGGGGGRGGNAGGGVSAPGETEEGDSDNHEEQLEFACDPTAPRSELPLRRLSRAQYKNSLRDVLIAAVGATKADAALKKVSGLLSALPKETATKDQRFARMDQAVTQTHIDGYFTLASDVADVLTQDADNMRALLGDCYSSTGAAADTCISNFITRVGARVTKRPLAADEQAFYREVYDVGGAIDARAVKDILVVMLNAPQMLYHVEDHGTEPQQGTSKLSSYETAARLSYQFWQTAPDEELLARAADGSLSSDAGYEAAVDYVLAHPKANAAIEDFVAEWFALDELRSLDDLVGTPVFDAFVGDDVPSPELRDAMIADVTESLRYHTLVEPGTLRDWFDSPYSFAKGAELASIYGTELWDGQGTPPEFPEGERAGLITRAALLSTGSANTRPIMKGVFIRRNLLCDDIAPPPANAVGTKVDLSPEFTTRQVVEALTQQPSSSCVGCHGMQINGLGFPTENYDALGRIRDAQDLYDTKGKVVASPAVHTEAIPRVWVTDQNPVQNASELAARIRQSGKLEACFAKQYFRYTFARSEQKGADGCVLEDVRSRLTKGATVADAMRAVAMRQEFRTRMM